MPKFFIGCMLKMYRMYELILILYSLRDYINNIKFAYIKIATYMHIAYNMI